MVDRRLQTHSRFQNGDRGSDKEAGGEWEDIASTPGHGADLPDRHRRPAAILGPPPDIHT